MNAVLLDFHHSDLLNSLHLLFERMGAKVYVPYGLDWFTEGIWRQGHAHFGDAIARQFLLTPEVDELQPARKLNRLTLDEAKGMDFAVVVASVPDNYAGYHRFAQEHGARFAIEVGNVNQWVDHSLGPVILDSTGQYPGGVAFTPEYDIDGAFRYEPPMIGLRRVSSFVNLFPGLPCFGDFLSTLEHLSDWSPNVHGHKGAQGFIKPTAAIGDRMRASSFIWHDKVTGDGFGYVIHYAASVGRPLVGHASHYRGQQAEYLWDDLVTCIDLDKHPVEDVAKLMDSIVRDDRLEEMGEILARRVRERIDFAADADRVADALGLTVLA